MRKKGEFIRYYKTKLYRGRTFFARATDFLAFRIIAFVLLYIWFSRSVDNAVLRIMLPIISLMALCVAAELFKSVRLERFITFENNRLRSEILCERFTVLPKNELFKLVREYASKNPDKFSDECMISVIQQTSPITADNVLAIYQNALKRGASSAVIFCTSNITDEASAFIKKHNDVAIEFITTQSLAEFVSYQISDEAVEEYILSQISEAREKRKNAVREPFAKIRMKRYFIISALLFVTSFFVHYPLYYRIIAMVAATFGLTSFWLDRYRPNDQQ